MNLYAKLAQHLRKQDFVSRVTQRVHQKLAARGMTNQDRLYYANRIQDLLFSMNLPYRTKLNIIRRLNSVRGDDAATIEVMRSLPYGLGRALTQSLQRRGILGAPPAPAQRPAAPAQS